MIQRPNLYNRVVALVDSVIRISGRVRIFFNWVKTNTDSSEIEISVLTSVVESHVAATVPQAGRSLGHSRQVIQRAANALIGSTRG